MKRFRIHADAIFEAEGIDDAFWRLANYFKALAEGLDEEEPLEQEGHIVIALDDDREVWDG